MRQLTSKQKKLLDAWIISYPKEGRELNTCDDLLNIDYRQLEQINDTEILYQEVNRYLWDKRF